MPNPIGPLTTADEGFCHQVVDTFAVVGTSDLAWTEKVCAMAAAKDGSLQLGFGLGKYNNRNVMDAYAGISRGVEQITVRSSRRLSPDPVTTTIGPIRYEIIEPLQQIRFVLEPNDVQPIAFDWLFDATVPASMEERTHQRAAGRVSAELVRYHQIGLPSGWVEVDGARTEITPDSWVSTRDHSWGVRYGVGAPMDDLEPTGDLSQGTFHFCWSPLAMVRPDGSRYGIFLNLGHTRRPGLDHKSVMGAIEHPDGRTQPIVDLVPELRYHPENRRLQGGRVHVTLADGSTRTLEVEVVSDTGFHLGAGLYFGLDGHYHGEWRGESHLDGERIADCTEPETARRLHQIRDTVVHVVDRDGGGEGWGNWQPIITGHFPELGLTAASSFV
jgi:hypothetical protein